MASQNDPKNASTAADDAENIETLHAAVAAFQQREIGYRDVLEGLPAAIYTTDADGWLTYFNRACIEFSGREPTLGDDSWCVSWRLKTPEGEPLPHSECPMAIALHDRRSINGAEALAVRPDGSTVNFLAYPTPIFDDADEMIGAVNMLVDISAQKQSQERLELMADEVNHRAKNLLNVMLSLVHLTKADNVVDYKRALEGRFASLARSNALISADCWTEVDLRTLINDEISTHGSDTVSLSGDHFQLSPSSAQVMGMIVHELFTNAIKHGALSIDDGSVAIRWEVAHDGTLTVDWEENGGPVAAPPVANGIGLSVIAHSLRRLGGSIAYDWSDSGLRCTLRCAGDRL